MIGKGGIQSSKSLSIQGGAPESAVAFKILSLKATADSGVPPCMLAKIAHFMFQK